MQTINLKQYYPFCKEDICVEVSDEIVEAFLLDKRAEAARDRKMFRYKAFYSLDCNDGIENAAIGWAQPSPEDHLIEKEELAEYEELIRRLYEAISSLPPMQARRVHARYMLGMKVKDIAAMEGITPVYDNLKVSQIIIEKSPRRKYNIPMTYIGRLGDVKSNGQARNNNFTLS